MLYVWGYDGPVMKFNECISNRWIGKTIANSKERAKSNLIYQFKKQNNLLPSAMITLPGEITMLT